MLTDADAQALHDGAVARGTWLAWVVSNADLEHPGRFVARAHTCDHHGGVYLPGALIADTLVALRAQLPAGMTCHVWCSVDPPHVVEVWEWDRIPGDYRWRLAVSSAALICARPGANAEHGPVTS